MIAITHTPANGTILEGTTRGDGTNHILNTGGHHWRWSRNLEAWYIPRSRDTAPQTALITATAEQLRAAGRTHTADRGPGPARGQRLDLAAGFRGRSSTTATAQATGVR